MNVDFDTGEPTDNLSAIALKECESVGSTSKRVSEVIGGGDPKILEMIEKGIKRANDKAISNAQKVAGILLNSRGCLNVIFLRFRSGVFWPRISPYQEEN